MLKILTETNLTKIIDSFKCNINHIILMKQLTPIEKKKKGYRLTTSDRREINFANTKSLLEKEYGKKLTDMQVRYLERGYRYQLIYDIETSDFNPYQNFIICYVAHMRDILTGKVEKFQYSITKKDIQNAVDRTTFDFDRKLLQKLSQCIKSADHVVGHFSTKFDNNFFTSRCLLSNQAELIPDWKTVDAGDTWRMMKTQMKAPRNTLNNLILQTTGTSQKTHVDLKYWYTVKFPKSKDWQKSMDYIVDHCVKDVKMTEKALKKIEKFCSIGGASF